MPEILSYNDGGIGDVDIADPTKALEVLVGPIALSQKDKIELYWGSSDDPVATYVHSPSAPDTNGIFSLYVPTYFIEPGLIEVFYRFTPFPSVIPEKSEPLFVLVKLTVPGGRDPDPESPYQHENLIRPIVMPVGVITTPDGVVATIDPYENMTVGDSVALYWNGLRTTLPPLTKEQLYRPVQIPVSKEIILEAGDSDSILVRYDIRDVVNNWSRFSLPTYVEVEAGNSTLPAPVAPQAVNLELDLTLLAGADVQALVLSYPGNNPADEITLTLERNTAEGMALEPYVSTKPVGTSVGFVEFFIPNEQFTPIAQGRARLKYKVTKEFGEELRSKSLPLTVVGETQVLAPPKLPAAEQNNGVLDPTAHNVITLVPAYYFMADGNDVTLVWMGKTASGANVIHEEVKNLNSDDVGVPLAFLIPDEKVSALAGGTLELYYTVTTFARAFFKSPSLHVQVSADESALLPPANVDGLSADGVLDPDDLVLEAIVRIQPFTSMAPLDKVILHWDGTSSGGVYSTSTTLNSGTSGKEVVFRVKKTYVDANLNRNVKVSYTVERGNQTLFSDVLIVKVGAPGLTLLPKPTVAGVDSDNNLIPENVPDSGVQVSVPRYTGIDGKDSIIVKWVGGSSHTTAPQDAGEAGAITFTVPKSVAVGSAGTSAGVTYNVTRGVAAPVESTATTFQVQALAPPLNLGADYALALAGYVVFEGRPPANPPISAIYTRAATGGQPPYQYQSSDPRVALVDQDGKVTAAGNGVTAITATDALGATASYQLTTSGARVFVGFPDVRKDFYGYRAFCDQQGVHSMNANDFKQLRAVYAGESPAVGQLFGWNNGWGWWTNEQVSSGSLGNSRAFNLDSGSVDLVSNNFQLNCFGIKK
ncbi:hypothetical protein QN391_23755 [Pseudomonas sp. CCI1.2]|uniref:hypothetical protein n=1 Tax=Pseudomonas sp. CCI1.2 TaxID=3048614 RepID=UPI002B225594|nr:hypothetical protein [Pseudomonas sp. CCI1.2]MEB0123674.1 hypothetical protein [Pseudomonas sp. CCI1.2]